MRRHSLRDIAWAIADEYGLTIEEAARRLDESLWDRENSDIDE